MVEKNSNVSKSDTRGGRPLVSVIIPVKNGLPEFERVLAGLQDQEFEHEFEVLVIDSGSSDGSKEAIPHDDPRFKLIEIDSADFGHGKTRNYGIELSEGDYCAFLTHDAAPFNEHWLRNLVRPLLEDEEVAGVFGRHVGYEHASPFTKWELETHFDGLRQWPVVQLDDARAYTKDIGLQQVYHYYSDNSSCLRKSVWDEIPYADVDFSEDQLWAKAIVEAGHKKAYAADSVVYHSHDYSLMERFRRSFDEARAFKRLFGYQFCSSRRTMLKQAFLTTKRDLGLAIKNGWIFRYPLTTLLKPFDNLSRQIGYYYGTVNPDLVASHGHIVSRDKRLQRQ
ncbi:MAG: glycosyltransferase family 2 protein [Pseudomonadota bacterium]